MEAWDDSARVARRGAAARAAAAATRIGYGFGWVGGAGARGLRLLKAGPKSPARVRPGVGSRFLK